MLAVRIHSILPRGKQPIGTTALIPEFGGLVGTAQTALLNDPLPERVKKMEVTEQGVRFNKKITLPYEPFLGTLGVSPEIEAVTSLQPDYWGGNMDVPDVAPGAILYFPVLHRDSFAAAGHRCRLRIAPNPDHRGDRRHDGRRPRHRRRSHRHRRRGRPHRFVKPRGRASGRADPHRHPRLRSARRQGAEAARLAAAPRRRVDRCDDRAAGHSRACTAPGDSPTSAARARSASAGSRPASARSLLGEVATLNLKSGTGDITVDRVTGDAEVTAGSGDVRVRELARQRRDQELQR